ncbi:MAG TPA: hypothetical protein VMP01_05300 [Pirellulaceae bacterium]|nr:hypothetical protein [Pirellulaceae bacterium]
MPIDIVAEPFSAAKLAGMADLNCGNNEHGRIATNWILGTNPDDSVLCDLKAHPDLQVFLYYEVGTDRLVGFGSLGLTTRSGLEFSIIPHMGIDVQFHGVPAGAPWSDRPSALVMSDLIARAGKLPPAELSLFVHKDNLPARTLYKRLGFEPVGNINKADHQRMVLRLR